MPKLPRGEPERCPFPKHKGRLWASILEDDPQYVHWVVSMEGPPLTNDQYDHIMVLLEDHPDE